MSERTCPKSLLDLADPEWEGKVVLLADRRGLPGDRRRGPRTRGRGASRATWLAGLKANGTVYDGNNVVLEAVNAGEIADRDQYHYYWYRDQAESGDLSDDSALHFFGNQDPGAFLSISGAGILDVQRAPGRRARSSSSTSSARRASRPSRTATPWSTRSTRPSSSRPGQAVRRARPADRRRLRPRQRQGGRAPDRGRVPLTLDSPDPVGPAAPRTPRRRGDGTASSCLVLVRGRRRRRLPGAARYVVVESARTSARAEACDFLFRPRIGELLWNTVRLLVGGVTAQHRARRGRRLAGGSAPTCPARRLWHGLSARRSPSRPSSTGYAWISTTHAVRELPRRRRWSSASPTTRWSTSPRSRHCTASTRGSRTSPPRSATAPVAPLPAHRAAGHQPGRPRRLPAGGPAPARGVRRARRC